MSLKILLFLALIFEIHRSRSEDQPLLFDYHPRKKLNVLSTAKTQSVQVSQMLECFGKCKEVDCFQSGDFKITPEMNNFHVCELLPSDRFSKSNSLTDDPAYKHFNKKVRCELFQILIPENENCWINQHCT